MQYINIKVLKMRATSQASDIYFKRGQVKNDIAQSHNFDIHYMDDSE